MTTILTKKKDTAGAPAPGDLTNAAGGAELAVNTATKRLYSKDSGGNIIEIGTNPSDIVAGSITDTGLTSGRVTYASTGGLLVDSANLTFNGTTLTANTLNLTNALVTTYGGTGLTSFTAGDLPYYATGTALSKLGIGTSNQVLTSSGTAPQWSSSLTVTGLTDSGNLTFTGTGNRITGDFSNATHSNRVLFQTSTTNGNTIVGVIPNGTSTTAQLNLYNNSDPTNASLFQAITGTGEVSLRGGNTGTGTFLPMTFYTGGSERMRLDTSGNVGIGTNAPVSKLQVTNSLAITATGGYQFLLMGNQDSLGTNKPTIIRSANASLQFGIGDSWSSSTGGIFTPYLNIGDTGNVGIGTSAPSYKLDVSGTFRATGLSNFDNAISLNTATLNYLYYTSALAFAQTGTGERMRIDSSGNVGIGTTTLTNKLNVAGAIQSSAVLSAIEANTVALSQESGYGRLAAFGANSSTPGVLDLYVISSNGSVQKGVRIDSSGNVGIGTSSPTALITIAAGTATANTSPLKFTSGTNLTTPEAGVVEYDGTVMTATSNTNFKRGTIPLTNYASGTGTALGTNTEATLAVLLPAANDTITLSIGTYFLDVSFIITRGATSTTSATARLNILGTGNAVGTFSGMSLSAPTAGGATANFSFDGVNINTSNVLTAASTTAAGVYTMRVSGLMKITTAGTIIPQYNLSANINAAGTVAKVLYLRLQQVDSQSAAAAGPAGTGWG